MMNLLMGLGLVIAAMFWSVAEWATFIPAHWRQDCSTWGFGAILVAFALSLIAWGLGIGEHA